LGGEPYHQFFCGEEFFQHRRQRMGEEKLQAFPQESLSVATKTEALNPLDWRRMQLTKDNEGRYIGSRQFGNQAPVAWNLPIVTSPSLQQDKFLIGAFAMAAQLSDRQETTVELSTEAGDNFKKTKSRSAPRSASHCCGISTMSVCLSGRTGVPPDERSDDTMALTSKRTCHQLFNCSTSSSWPRILAASSSFFLARALSSPIQFGDTHPQLTHKNGAAPPSRTSAIKPVTPLRKSTGVLAT
jgi:hypothetical protein